VARVGDVTIPPRLVAEVAATKGISARDAVSDLVIDALAAQGARARGLDADPAVAWAGTAALARRIPARLAVEAADEGPPKDAELASVLVANAVVLRSPTLREHEALIIAENVRRAVAGARTVDDFVSRANAVSHHEAKLVAQPIGPFAADGADPGGGVLDAGFVAAAFALRTPFEVSPVIVTPFGWHVVELIERTPPADSDLEARRTALAGAVRAMRSRMRLDALLRELRSSARVETGARVDDLMARATASP
jgi:hypothetical protein